MSKEYKYTYKFSEQSVDVRHWEVQSNKKLTEEEMLDLGFSTDLRNEGSVYTDENVKATFIGTEFGDDAQIQIEQGEEDLIPDDSIIEDYHNWGMHG